MATQVLTPVEIKKDTPTANILPSGGTSIVAADTFVVKYPIEDKIMLMLNNTAASSKNFYIRKGNFTASGQGDLTVPVGTNEVKYVILSSDRFLDKDGYLKVEFEAGTTGYVRAFRLP